MEMGLLTQDDVKRFLEQVPAAIKDNPSFHEAFGSKMESMVYDYQLMHNGPMKVYMSEDGKFIRLKDMGVKGEDQNGPKFETFVLDLTLNDDDSIEVVESHGTEHMAQIYAQKTGEKIPYGTSVIFDKFYERKLFDKEGIEQCVCSFSVDKWALSNTDFGNVQQLQGQLLSNGEHKPASWGGEGPDFPRYSQNASVYGITRLPSNPALALVYNKTTDTGNYVRYTKNDNFAATIHSEWPHHLRVDYPNIFANIESGKLELRDDYYNQEYKDMPIEDVVKDLSLRYEAALEGSKTKENLPAQYETLKARLQAANAKYKPQEMTQEQPEMSGVSR